MKRYAKLWVKFKEREFSRDEAAKVLKNDKALAVFLSNLRKAGWMHMKFNEKDARKAVYQLKEPTKAILEEIKELSNSI